MNIAILGGGNVGGALGGAWARAGHRIIFGVREPAADKTRRLLEATGRGATACDNAAAAAAGDVVVVATPWNTTVAAVQSAGDLRGKTVIDCTNPLRYVPGTGLELERGFSDSGAETVARAVPGANVVKAFNSYGWENLADARYPNSAGLKPVMFLAGDDAPAKAGRPTPTRRAPRDRRPHNSPTAGHRPGRNASGGAVRNGDWPRG